MPIATNSDKINLSSENKTEELANKIVKKLKLGDIIFLYGEIGVGKTTFVKYLVNGFQKKKRLKEIEVTSPTFTLLNEYKIDQFKINHYDLFRIKSVEELDNLEIFSDYQSTITLIEWPQIIKERPENLIELNFKYEKDYKNRSVQIRGLNL
jgi:tRNA threonylcarbamoyladenosine biosynthesis protein TsaE